MERFAGIFKHFEAEVGFGGLLRGGPWQRPPRRGRRAAGVAVGAGRAAGGLACEPGCPDSSARPRAPRRDPAQPQGLIEDPTILFVGEVELVELKAIEDEPLVVVQFNCQQIKCTRDKFGNVVDGSPNSIQKVGGGGRGRPCHGLAWVVAGRRRRRPRRQQRRPALYRPQVCLPSWPSLPPLKLPPPPPPPAPPGVLLLGSAAGADRHGAARRPRAAAAVGHQGHDGEARRWGGVCCGGVGWGGVGWGGAGRGGAGRGGARWAVCQGHDGEAPSGVGGGVQAWGAVQEPRTRQLCSCAAVRCWRLPLPDWVAQPGSSCPIPPPVAIYAGACVRRAGD
jgi:hypothetical protein